MKAIALGLLAFCSAGPAAALDLTFSGRLDDTTNSSLVGSDLGSPYFDATPENSSNNVSLQTFTVAADGSFLFTSAGYAAGGIDPYVSLFAGNDNTATFLQSFYSASYPGDFPDAILNLLAGDYILAIGLWENMSFAENYGTGTLGDGFIGLGSSVFGNGYYEVRISSHDGGGGTPVPEPGTLALLVLGLAGIGFGRGRSRQVAARPPWT